MREWSTITINSNPIPPPIHSLLSTSKTCPRLLHSAKARSVSPQDRDGWPVTLVDVKDLTGETWPFWFIFDGCIYIYTYYIYIYTYTLYMYICTYIYMYIQWIYHGNIVGIHTIHMVLTPINWKSRKPKRWKTIRIGFIFWYTRITGMFFFCFIRHNIFLWPPNGWLMG